MKVAVLGAGASGLPAIKSCLDEGLEPVCFEKTDDIGGLWNWQENPTDGRSTVMKTTIINTSKETSFYSDFIVPREYPNYMHNTKVLSYFRLYAENFGLLKYIKFRTEVKRLSQAENFSETGRWKLEIKDLQSGATSVEEFDRVMVCTGHHAEKKIPRFEGQEKFEGKIVHTHDYTDHRGYEDKRVIVVGIGNSGADVTVELSKLSKQVYLSTRRGSWILYRVADNGMPFDLVFLSRYQDYLNRLLPINLSNYLIERHVEKRFDHSLYGLKPKHRFSEAHPTASDDLANRLIAGNVIVKPDIRRLHARSVEFEDGTIAENIDAIICATGYLFGFPFIDHKAFEVKDNIVNLYKQVFPPDISPPTLAVIGCFQPIGGLMPVSEMQCRWATRVFKGELRVPSPELMWADIRNKRKDLSTGFYDSTRHTMEVPFVQFMDELADLCGCKPNLLHLLFTDPKLALAMIFGPCAPYQYRLTGKGAWSGARKAILTIKERVEFPLKTRKTPESTSSTFTNIIIAIISVALLSIFINVCFS